MADDYDPWGLNQTASDYGFDPQFLRRVIKVESGGNPNNRTGSYKGLLQLSDQEFNANGGGNIYDPVDNLRAGTKKLAAERDAFEAKYGRPPTPTDIYMLHQQGAGGYAQHLANPEAPAWQNMLNTGEGRQKGEGWAKRAIWGNVPDQLKQKYGSVDNVSSSDFIGDWRNKIEGDIPYIEARASGSPAGMPVQAADDFSAIASMRGPRMAEEAPGLLASLAGQQQQGGGGIGGLLGSLNPEKMAYLAMIAKGLNPYTDVDPTKMLALAHSARENAIKLAQQQREHELDREIRRGSLDVSTRAEDRQQRTQDLKEQLEAARRKAAQDIYGGGGGGGGPASDAAGGGGAVPYLGGNPFGVVPAASDPGAQGAEGAYGATDFPDTGPALGAAGAQGATSAPSAPTIPFAGGVAAPPGVPTFTGAPPAAAAPTAGPAGSRMTREKINQYLSIYGDEGPTGKFLTDRLKALDAAEKWTPVTVKGPDGEETVFQNGLGQFRRAEDMPGAVAPAKPRAGEPIPTPPPGADIKEWNKKWTDIRTAQESRRPTRVSDAKLVIEDIGRAEDVMDKAVLPTTGALGGQVLKHLGGTAAHSLDALLSSIGDRISVDKLQQIRQESPTGAAFGNVSDKEGDRLKSLMGSIRQSQTDAELKFNLNRFRQEYNKVIHGPTGTPMPGAKQARNGDWYVPDPNKAGGYLRVDY